MRRYYRMRVGVTVGSVIRPKRRIRVAVAGNVSKITLRIRLAVGVDVNSTIRKMPHAAEGIAIKTMLSVLLAARGDVLSITPLTALVEEKN